MWHSQRMESYLPLTLELADIAMRERGLSIDAIRPPEPITWSEVTQISRDDLIRFESHGVSHAAMSTLTDEELIFEMKHSRDLVSGYTGRPCRHLAYPFGSERSIGPRAALIAQQFYDSAATMTLGKRRVGQSVAIAANSFVSGESNLVREPENLTEMQPPQWTSRRARQ